MMACEMFENSGLRVKYNTDYCITYSTEWKQLEQWVDLDFIKKDKTVVYTHRAPGISLEDRPPYILAEAIEQQKKELGWCV